MKRFWEYEPYNIGDELIKLESDSIIELDDEIPFGGSLVVNVRYTTLDRFIDAENTEELWK